MLQAPCGSLVAVEWVLKSDSCYPLCRSGCVCPAAPGSTACRALYILFLSTQLGKRSEIPGCLGCIFLLVTGTVHTDVQYLRV